MTRERLVKIFAAIVALSGMVVAFGWALGVGPMKTFLLGATEMKFLAALCFVTAGIVLYAAAEPRPERSVFVQAVLPAANLFIAMLMGAGLVSVVFRLDIGIENIFVPALSGVADGTAPGQPSVPGMAALVLVAVAGLGVLSDRRRHVVALGVGVLAVGAIATVGYLLGRPALYFAFPGTSNPIAANSALLLILTGTGLIVCGKRESR